MGAHGVGLGVLLYTRSLLSFRHSPVREAHSWSQLEVGETETQRSEATGRVTASMWWKWDQPVSSPGSSLHGVEMTVPPVRCEDVGEPLTASACPHFSVWRMGCQHCLLGLLVPGTEG